MLPPPLVSLVFKLCLQALRTFFRRFPVTPDGKWGGSAMVALQIKNIPWGAGDDIKMDAS